MTVLHTMPIAGLSLPSDVAGHPLTKDGSWWAVVTLEAFSASPVLEQEASGQCLNWMALRAAGWGDHVDPGGFLKHLGLSDCAGLTSVELVW